MRAETSVLVAPGWAVGVGGGLEGEVFGAEGAGVEGEGAGGGGGRGGGCGGRGRSGLVGSCGWLWS